jgi:hypothetical protein
VKAIECVAKRDRDQTRFESLRLLPLESTRCLGTRPGLVARNGHTVEAELEQTSLTTSSPWGHHRQASLLEAVTSTTGRPSEPAPTPAGVLDLERFAI